MLFDFLKDINNYNDRKVGRTEVNGLIISTAFTSDEGYETAIIDANGVHPVERYISLEASKEGHEKWIKEAPLITTVLKLGFGGMINDEEIILKRL